jgi:hypothetical protein
MKRYVGGQDDKSPGLQGFVKRNWRTGLLILALAFVGYLAFGDMLGLRTAVSSDCSCKIKTNNRVSRGDARRAAADADTVQVRGPESDPNVQVI